MIVKLYTIRDVQADRAIQPILRENEGIAVRDFEQMMHDTSPFNNNPDDYVLYYIGEWNDETMHIVPSDPTRIIDGLSAFRNRANRIQRVQELQMDIEDIINVSPGGTD